MNILAILSPFLIGSAIIVILFPQESLRKVSFILTVCLGTGLGFGITSALLFLWLALYGQPPPAYFYREVGFALFLVLFAGCRIYFSKNSPTDLILKSNPDCTPIAWLKNIFFILLFFSLASYVLKILGDNPHGQWDAWAIWNFRARWLFRGDTLWPYGFSTDVIESHPDYPLLIPVSVFRMWNIIGKDSIAVPIAISGFFTFGSIFLILQSLSMIRGQNQGYLAAILMLLATQFFKIGTYQYADVPLAFFILSTILLLSLKESYPSAASRIMFLAGLSASCAAWTKNEGILFLVLMTIVFIMSHLILNDGRRFLKESFSFLLGITPIVSIEIFFKLKITPPNDIVNLHNLSVIWNYFLQLERYQQIFVKFAKKIFLFNDGIVFLMIVYFFISGFDKSFANRRSVLPQFILLVLLLGGYFFSYIISPYDLKLHLNSSLYRLIMHIWPSWVFLFFLCTKGAERPKINEKQS